jgi:hypothetical protein
VNLEICFCCASEASCILKETIPTEDVISLLFITSVCNPPPSLKSGYIHLLNSTPTDPQPGVEFVGTECVVTTCHSVETWATNDLDRHYVQEYNTYEVSNTDMQIICCVTENRRVEQISVINT